MLQVYRNLPEGLRKVISTVGKLVLTVGAFYLLLTHRIDDGAGGEISIADAIVTHMQGIDPMVFVPLCLAAAAIKFVGIVSSMVRWHLLLKGQGIRFNFGHIFGTFLIGRFLGTFLPSTVGLDSYKLYDAARFSERVIEPAAATAVEKVMGLSGIFLTFLVTLPFGYAVLFDVLDDRAPLVIVLTVAISVAVVTGLFTLLFWPAMMSRLLGLVPAFGRRRFEAFITRVSKAATAYRGKGRLLAAVIALSFAVHFTTAAMYYFTALAVNAHQSDFWMVAFASSMQIFATVLSPITIGGEGIREAVQMLLLTKHMGASQAILSAALGFWAAEALTLLGAVFWWARRKGYRPKVVELTLASDARQGDAGRLEAAVEARLNVAAEA